MRDNEAIATIKKPAGNNPKHAGPRPGCIEPREYLQHRSRIPINRVPHNQDNTRQVPGAVNAFPDNRLADWRLLCREAENARRIMPNYESDPGVAQVADSVEQNQRRLGAGSMGWCTSERGVIS